MQPLSESANSRHERTERYRREAVLVRTIAEATVDPQTRHELLDVARNYEILAMSIELLPPDRYP
jgi:predicted kinase